MLISILNTVNLAILIYFFILSLGYILLLIGSIPDVFSRYKESKQGDIITLMRSSSLPPITVLIPAYNEESFICDMVNSVLNSNYKNTYAIIINDGSTDNTLKKLLQMLDLKKIPTEIEKKIPSSDTIRGYYISTIYKNITVIDKEHTDRSDTLNTGINACLTPLSMTMDSDTLIEADAISRMVFYMLNRPAMVAAGGGVYILNGCIYKNGHLLETKMSTKPLYAFQTCEYLRSFLFSKSGWNALGGSLCYSGAFTAFKHNSLIDVGGFDINNLAQDFEIITHIRAQNYESHSKAQVGYTPAAIVWTDVPGTLKEYWSQRFNWQFATLQSLMPYKRMLFNPRYGIVGFFTYPFFLLGETLGAVVEFTAYLSVLLSLLVGALDVYTAVLFFLFCWGFLTLLTMVTLFMNFNTFNKYKRLRDLFFIFCFTVIESLGFRQFNVACRMSATCSYLFRKRKC